jgi:hypothetical protein
VRRARDRVGSDRLRDPGSVSFEHRARRLGRDVARRHTGAAGRQHHARFGREDLERARDRVRVVGDDTAIDLEAVALEERREQVAARVLAGARGHAVGHRQHGGSHAFVFSSTRTSPIVISPSIAFAMS